MQDFASGTHVIIFSTSCHAQSVNNTVVMIRGEWDMGCKVLASSCQELTKNNGSLLSQHRLWGLVSSLKHVSFPSALTLKLWSKTITVLTLKDSVSKYL